MKNCKKCNSSLVSENKVLLRKGMTVGKSGTTTTTIVCPVCNTDNESEQEFYTTEEITKAYKSLPQIGPFKNGAI